MKKVLLRTARLVLPVCVFLVATGSVFAQDEGLRLSKTCAGCHGTFGASAGSHTPIIGGQTAESMSDAMSAYREDIRTDSPLMSAIAKAYDDAAVSALAGYFAEQQWVASENPFERTRARDGFTLAVANACDGCHGDKGVGMGEFPRIGGQQPGYLALTLERYADGTRTSDMMSFVSSLSARERDALAAYYTSLR